ncbi:unnamed protein product [Mucor hiemalis]
MMRMPGFLMTDRRSGGPLQDLNSTSLEMDFLSVVWSPLFKKMTYIHNNVILLKGGSKCTSIRKEEDLDVGALQAAKAPPSETYNTGQPDSQDGRTCSGITVVKQYPLATTPSVQSLDAFSLY